jgi:hypothetical protein
VPDGPYAGQPLELTGDQSRVLFRFYEVDDEGRFVYRRGCWRAPQGVGKSPLLGAVSLVELAGPSKFGGWDKQGRPIGVVPHRARVELAATSEDQSGTNTYSACRTMAVDSDLDLDVGLLRIVRRDGGGELEPVSAAAGSRLGARVSFAVLDESSLWTRANRGDRLADVLRRNCSKSGGRTFETSNAFAAGEGSVCEATHEAATADAPGLLYVVQQGPPVDDLTDTAAVLESLRVAYGDAALDRGGWVDLDRVAADMADPNADEDSMRRYHLGHITSGGSPMDIEKWKTLARPGRVVDDGTYIGTGFDGSFSADSTAHVKCTPTGSCSAPACGHVPTAPRRTGGCRVTKWPRRSPTR